MENGEKELTGDNGQLTMVRFTKQDVIPTQEGT